MLDSRLNAWLLVSVKPSWMRKVSATFESGLTVAARGPPQQGTAKLDRIVQSGARVVATGNPGCLMQIAKGARAPRPRASRSCTR